VAAIRKTFHYGWANLGVAALAMVGTLPGRTQGLGLITEPLIGDPAESIASTTRPINLWATLIGALFCLPCGRLTDRFGARTVLTGIALALGATVIAMSGATGAVALCIAITLTRGFGQSALSVVSLALVGKWFARRLNIAMAYYSLLVGIGFIAAFPSVGAAVTHVGWRVTWSGVGWFLVAILAPAAWFIVRSVPEDAGLHPDGESNAQEIRGAEDDLTLWQALRSPAFWVFALSSSVFGLVYSGISLFNESILAQRGFKVENVSSGARGEHRRRSLGELRRRVAGVALVDSEIDGRRDGGAGSRASGAAAGADTHARDVLRCRDGDLGRRRDGRVFLRCGDKYSDERTLAAFKDVRRR
jgi:MFS family permease